MGRTSPTPTRNEGLIDQRELLAEAREIAQRIIDIVEVIEEDLEAPRE